MNSQWLYNKFNYKNPLGKYKITKLFFGKQEKIYFLFA